MEQNPTFDTFAEKEIGCFGEELVLFAFAFDEQFLAVGRNRSGLAGREIVGTDVVSELSRVGFSHRWVLVVTVRLAGDDLPSAVALQPGVGGVVTRVQLLTEDRFGFAEVVAQDSGIADDPALDVGNLNRAGIPSRHWGDVGDELGFIEGPAFFVGKDAIIREIFFPGHLISRRDRIAKLLGATDELVLGDRDIGGVSEGCDEEGNEGEFHKGMKDGR